MKVLAAVDESDHAVRVAQYVGTLLQDVRDMHVTVFHVLKPIPRSLLEHGGSENPETEARLQAELREGQANWLRTQREAECPYLIRARDVLTKAGMPVDHVDLKFGHEDDIARNIIEEAKTGGYSTIVIGRNGSSGRKRPGATTEQVLRDAVGMTVWVVD